MIHLDATQTIPFILKQRIEATPADIAFVEKDGRARWRHTTWRQFDTLVDDLAKRLASLGMYPGDQVGLMMPNSLLWEVIQHAVLRLGAVVVGLDRNDPPERMAAVFSSCSLDFLFADTVDSLTCIPDASLKAMRWIICSRIGDDQRVAGNVLSIDDLPEGSNMNGMPAVSADQTATIIFTSGTTGTPKALSFNHGQLIQAVASITAVIDDMPAQAHTACWLPLANPFQRIVNLCGLADNWKVFMVPDPATILKAVGEIAPHLFASVPRFYEKLYEGIHAKMAAMPKGIAKAAHRAQQVGQRYHAAKKSGDKVPWSLKWRFAAADRLVLRRIRAVMGRNILYLVSGSAPAGPGMLDAFGALGWRFLEAYGISENIIPMAINPPAAMRTGSVGRPLAGNTIRIAQDREILVKSPGLAGETKPRQVDAFLPTGDLGEMDEDGYLYITGRKSDMFKLSTGRKIEPVPVEAAVSRIDDVQHCVVAGRSRKYVVAVANIHERQWQERIRSHGGLDQARAHLMQQVHKACSHLPAYSRPADVTVVTDIFSPGTGELTANQKLRRKAVLEKYAAKIDALYDESDGNPQQFRIGFKSPPVQASQNNFGQKAARLS